MHFINFKSWLNERAAEKLEYGCLMMGANIPDWNKKISIVKEEDLYVEDNDYGYEKEPHVTIMYGLHDDEIQKDEFYKALKNLDSIQCTITHVGIFKTDRYDVVKFDVPLTPELKAYNFYFQKFYPNTPQYDDYKPHMTIAYVKSGEGKKYIQNIKPFKVTFNTVFYSYKNNKKIFDLA